MTSVESRKINDLFYLRKVLCALVLMIPFFALIETSSKKKRKWIIIIWSKNDLLRYVRKLYRITHTRMILYGIYFLIFMTQCNSQLFLFFAKSLEKVFKDYIIGRRLYLALKSSYIFHVVFTVSIFVGNPYSIKSNNKMYLTSLFILYFYFV